MKKNNRILGGIILLLILLIGVSAYLNRENVANKKQMNEEARFAVVSNEGVVVKTYTMEDIVALGETGFRANLKSSGKDPVEHAYTGVLLKKILEDAEIELNNKDKAVVTAIDGYVVAVTMEKVLDDDNVYLAYKRDGEFLGTREEGGEGPYQMIIRKDKFSQYWCKYAYSVEVN